MLIAGTNFPGGGYETMATTGLLSPSTSARWILPLLAVSTIAAAAGVGRPWLLANTTASEPRGLYIGALAAPAVGRLVAFQAPAAAFPYAGRTPILKAVAAGPGDLVCTTSGRLAINGRDRAPIARVDHTGRPLPRWIGCRLLRGDELFVFSDRVPNSLDSRYFGPVSTRQVLGVYTRLPLLSEAR